MNLAHQAVHDLVTLRRPVNVFGQVVAGAQSLAQWHERESVALAYPGEPGVRKPGVEGLGVRCLRSEASHELRIDHLDVRIAYDHQVRAGIGTHTSRLTYQIVACLEDTAGQEGRGADLCQQPRVVGLGREPPRLGVDVL